MTKEIDHIIARFWAGTATDAEKQQLARHLADDEPAWQEALQREFGQRLGQTDGPLTEAQSARVLARLHRQMPGEAATWPRVVSLWGRASWAAAAVLLLVAGFSLYQYAQIRRPVPTIAQHRTNKPYRLQRLTNTSQTVRHVALADGSALELQPGSSVSYYDPFGQPSRNISMTGEARFTVAKDPAHPFVVLANGFTTTALGTQFRVRATEKNRVSVRLFEGRVLVRATPESGLTMRDIYLKPGQEVNVNTKTNQISLAQFAQTLPPANHPATASPVSVPVLVFTKESLNTVFADVGKQYKVQIDYDPADVQGLSFSGSFNAADSLRVVLGAICTTNDLSFKEEAGKVIIRKSP